MNVIYIFIVELFEGPLGYLDARSRVLRDFRRGGGQKKGASYGCVRRVPDFFFSTVREKVRSNLMLSSNRSQHKEQRTKAKGTHSLLRAR
jgi:hypothetical protein